MTDAVTKVAIVPFNMTQRYIDGARDRNFFQPAEMSYLRDLDDGMKNILADVVSPPEIKYRKYMEFLKKFAAVTGNVTKPSEIEIKNKVSTPPAEPESEPAPLPSNRGDSWVFRLT